MSKIICEICGTKYPDTAEQCPICGYTNGVVASTAVEEEILDEVIQETKGSKTVKAAEPEQIPADEILDEKLLFEDDEDDDDDYEDDDDDEDDDDEDEDDEDDDEDDDEEEGKSGVVLNVLLGIVIVALLCVTGFIFVRYFLPNRNQPEQTLPATEATVMQTEAPETEAPTVPCTSLVLDETVVELNEIGQMHLLNAVIEPVDTTDYVTYASSDETVVMVNEEGRITAMGEGVATVTIFCGDLKVECTVTVSLVEETEAPTEEPTEAPTEEPTEAPTEPGKTVTVTSSWVKIRSGAGTEYGEVGKYEKGDVIVIYEEATCSKGRPWGRTDKGWICTEYVK